MKTRFLNIFLALGLLIVGPSLYALAEESDTPFLDVEPGDAHYVAIDYLKTHNIVSGYDDNTFRAKEKVNRAEALKMLTLASKVFSEGNFETGEITAEEIFSDTPVDSWYAKYLKTAKTEGIISGYDDGSFKPEQTINLAETLRIYLGCFDNLIYPNIGEYPFADVDPEGWYAKYIALGASRDLMDISSDNKVDPNQEMTRGYLAEIIYRMKMFSEGYRFGKATFYGAAVDGNGTASGETFQMDDYTAAHKTLAFGSIVQVTNLANGKTIEVKITDRGPYGPGRVLDLSSGAFKMIASLGAGVINVQYKVLFTP